MLISATPLMFLTPEEARATFAGNISAVFDIDRYYLL